jgi:transcriptional regulator GlxA family with amidase domain
LAVWRSPQFRGLKFLFFVLLLDRHASQAPYMVLRDLVREEPLVQAAERWVRRHLTDAVSVERLARAVGASPRTLARRLEARLGTTPLGFIHRIRLEAATHLLESSSQSLDEVAASVGYRDAGTLRRLIRRKLGTTPRELRQST